MKCKENEKFVHQAVLCGDLEITSTGEIWRIRKRGWDRWKSEVTSGPCARVRAEHDSGPYFQVRVMIDGVRVYALAHRLVYLHLKGPIPDGMTINHEDGNKKHNHPDNLAPATHSEQQIHATRVLRVGHACNQNGIRNSMAKLTPEQVDEIRHRRSSGERLLSIAADYGVRFQTISKVARGTSWQQQLTNWPDELRVREFPAEVKVTA